MVQSGSGIQNAEFPNIAARVHHNPCHDHGSLSDRDISRDLCGWVDSTDKANSRYQLSNAYDHSVSHPVVADCNDDAITKVRADKRRQIVLSSDYLVSKHIIRNGLIGIEQSDYLAVVLMEDVDNNSRMPRATDYNNSRYIRRIGVLPSVLHTNGRCRGSTAVTAITRPRVVTSLVASTHLLALRLNEVAATRGSLYVERQSCNVAICGNPSPSKHNPQRSNRDAEIEVPRHVVDIPHVHGKALVKGYPVASTNLRPAGKAGPHRMSAALFVCIVWQVSFKQRPGANDAEITPQNVPELWELIQTCAP